MKLSTTALGLAGVLAASHAHAQSAGGNDQEIAQLKQQLRLIEQKLGSLQKQTAANTAATANVNAAVPIKSPVASSGIKVTMPNNRPTICTADDENCFQIVSRIHWDVGGYDYRPNSTATVPQRLDDGENLRRARIGIQGKFLSDWNYALIYDFGGSSDGFGGAAAGSLPGAGASGVENAYLRYTGFKPLGGKMAIEGGLFDLPYTLDEATSSNDILFMERSSASNVATNIAAGDFRSAVGARWWTDRLFVGAYVTGPTAGAIHSASISSPNGATEQFGAVARVAGQVVSGKDYSLHIGGDAEWLIRPSQNLVTGAQTLTLSDRPELRIDPTTIVTTGALANVEGAQVYSAEAAATYGPLILQGEYYWYNIDRSANTGLPPIGAPNLQFQGGYAQAGYVLTGETHGYYADSASYTGIRPAHPFSLTGGGWGAWEIAGRVSTVDLNDRLATATGVAGGRQTVYTAALNWYVNSNVRFMLDYLHGDISRLSSPTSTVNAGATFDAVAMRTQIAF